ncbi:MAG: hypothetical protein M1820_008706 [Bogoriella megaspora]|nr:MAG: hypothetical protein M1820_008706 [Bogoriella megaspora]
MEDKEFAQHVEDGAANGSDMSPVEKPTFGQRLINHYRRFWWLHLIILIIVVLVVTLPLVYVGFPNIAQSQLNKSSLLITAQEVTEPTTDSVQLAQTGTAVNPSSYHPNLDSFTASYYLLDTQPNIIPFGNVSFPAVHAEARTTVSINQTFQILDQNQFLRYNQLTLSSKQLQVGVRGKTKLHEMKFPTANVDYNQIVTMNGLNNFEGFNITSFNLSLTPQGPDGANLIGEVFIPNPTVMTIAFGNVTFNVDVAGQNIGTSTLYDLILRPGNNTYPMRSTTNQTTVLGLITSKYKDGVLPLDITGDSVVYNGVHLPYFEKPLQGNKQHVDLNLASALQTLGINITELTSGGGGGL